MALSSRVWTPVATAPRRPPRNGSRDEPLLELPGEELKRVAMALDQVPVPKLRDAGHVSYDADRTTILQTGPPAQRELMRGLVENGESL